VTTLVVPDYNWVLPAEFGMTEILF
jgi:hypothetical protein